MTRIHPAARAARAGGELAQASGEVIARRLEVVAAALRDPANADYAELSLMGSEKVEALAASAAAGMSGALAAAGVAAGAAARENEAARRALAAAFAAPDAAEALSIHVAWAAGVWSRSVRRSWTFGAALIDLQLEALQPVHAAAVANARRLRRAG